VLIDGQQQQQTDHNVQEYNILDNNDAPAL